MRGLLCCAVLCWAVLCCGCVRVCEGVWVGPGFDCGCDFGIGTNGAEWWKSRRSAYLQAYRLQLAFNLIEDDFLCFAKVVGWLDVCGWRVRGVGAKFMLGE